MEIVKCDNCGMKVVRRKDGSCPSCGARDTSSAGRAPSEVPEPERSQQDSEPPSTVDSPETEQIEIQPALNEATNDDEITITADRISNTPERIRKSLQALRWGALLAWIAVLIGGKIGVLFSVGWLAILDAPVRKALSNTRALNDAQIASSRSHANLSVILGAIPIVIWFSGYLFWEEGFERFYPERWSELL